MPPNLANPPGDDPPAPAGHEVVFTPSSSPAAKPVVPVDRRPPTRKPNVKKLWTASVHFDAKGVAEFHPERLDPVPVLHDLGSGRNQMMVMQFRCMGIDAREGVLHADWMMTIGPRRNRQAIAKLLIDRKEELQLGLQALCRLRGEPAETLPREGSAVGIAHALVCGDGGKPVWRTFIWFVHRPQRPFTVSFPEWGLLRTSPHEWWQRVEWWWAFRSAMKMIDTQASDRWMEDGRREEIDLLIRPQLGRAATSAYAAANQDHEGLQRMLREFDVEMHKTQALPRDMPLEDLLAHYEAEVTIERRAFLGRDLG